jgi:hypothetical protein
MPSIRILAFVVALAALTSAPVAAHPAPFSYMDVRIRQASVDLALVVHVFDVAHELDIPIERVLEPVILRERGGAIQALMNERLDLVIDGRASGDAVWSDPEPLPDRQSIRLRSNYETAGTPAVVAVDALMFPYDAQHQTFVNVYEQDTLVNQSILDRERTRAEHFTGTRSGKAGCRARLRCGRGASRSDWTRSPALSHRLAAARWLHAAADRGGQRVYAGSQHHAVPCCARGPESRLKNGDCCRLMF